MTVIHPTHGGRFEKKSLALTSVNVWVADIDLRAAGVKVLKKRLNSSNVMQKNGTALTRKAKLFATGFWWNKSVPPSQNGKSPS